MPATYEALVALAVVERKQRCSCGVRRKSPDAEEALKLIEVEYEKLPAVLHAEAAMKPDAPILHERLTTAASMIDFPKRPTMPASGFWKVDSGKWIQGS